MREVTAYQCEHCYKVYRLKPSAKAHEKRCYLNPATRSCATCAGWNCKKRLEKLQTNCPDYREFNIEDYEEVEDV